jgi:hypothetical protein
MTGSAGNAWDSDLRISLPNWDAVITSTNVWSRKIDTRASLNVDAISVRAVCWGWNLDVVTFEVLALHKSYVKELAIQRSYASDNCLIHGYEFHILQGDNVLLINFLVSLSHLPIHWSARTIITS